MSRGFVKEGDQEEIPIVPPRAYLPPGVKNYVTQNGLNALLKEKDEIIAERSKVEQSNSNDKRIIVNFLSAKLALLEKRINTANVVDITKIKKTKIAFGAIVTLLRSDNTNQQKYQIVGVDEADLKHGKISFISPIAKAIMNKKIGETVKIKLPKGDVILNIIDINYPKT